MSPTLAVFIVHRQRGILLVTGFPHFKCEYPTGLLKMQHTPEIPGQGFPDF